jgi:hypothetical protein
MVTVQVTSADDGRLEMLTRFESDGMIGDGSADIGPGESYLGVDFDQWDEHAGRLVKVSGDPPSLTTVPTAL